MASRIREVWADNLDTELVALREALGQYPVVSMCVLHDCREGPSAVGAVLNYYFGDHPFRQGACLRLRSTTSASSTSASWRARRLRLASQRLTNDLLPPLPILRTPSSRVSSLDR